MNIINKIKSLIFKFKDYDRLESDYIRVLEHATLGSMSKSNYDIDTIFKIIDYNQSRFYCEMIKYDIKEILNNPTTASDSILEIEEYLNKL